MARPPRIESRELVQQIAVIRPAPAQSNALSEIGTFLGGLAQDHARETAAEQKANDELYLSRVGTDARSRAAEFAAESGQDPDAFRAAYDTWSRETLSNVPERIRQVAEMDLERIAGGQYVSLLNQQSAAARAIRDDALKASADGFRSDLLTAAEAGRFGEDEGATSARYRQTLDARVAAGFISQERADSLYEATQDEARGLLHLSFNRETYRQRGYLAALKDLETTLAQDETLTPELRDGLMNKGQQWLLDQRRIYEAEEAESERMIRQRREGVMAEAETLYVEGKLTQDWINGRSGVLTAEQRRSLRVMIQGDAMHVDDPEVLSELTGRMYRGDDVQEDALRYHREGRLTNEKLTSVLSRNRDLLRTSGPKSEYERQRSRIAQVLNPDFLPNGTGANIRQAEALEMLDSWLATAPNDQPRTDDQIKLKSDEIIERFSLTNSTEMLNTLPKPLYFVGSRQAPNIDATKMALRRALEEGRISEAEARSEALLIQRWEDAMRGLNR